MAHDRASPPTLTSGRRLARNVVWNLLGQGLPLLVGLATIPLLIDGLGAERFGILILAWMVVGYFSLFDLGLGRALTKLVAEKLGTAQETEVSGLTWTALAMMGVLGLVGMAVIAALSPWLVHGVMKIPAAFRAETLSAFYLLALSIPIVISTTGLRGVLEAYQRFDLVNAVRIPMGLWTFLGPLMVLPFSNSLFPVVAVLLAGRLLAWAVHMWLCLRVVPALRRSVTVQRGMVRPLLNFGSWMTVTNIVGPLMVYLDRFLVGAMVSMAAVAYYATPFGVVTRLWIIPVALVGVLFPAFSTTLVQDRARTVRLFGRGVNYTFLALFPVILVIVTLAHEGLTVWVGAEFAQNSTRVLQWLAVGVFINSLAFIPSTLIQSAGRPDLRAKTHIVELPIYLLVLWWLLDAYGIEGAAIAWTIRVAVDAVVFFGIARWLLPDVASTIRHGAKIVLGALGTLVLGAVTADLLMKCLFLLTALCLFAFASWMFVLEDEERKALKRALWP